MNTSMPTPFSLPPLLLNGFIIDRGQLSPDTRNALAAALGAGTVGYSQIRLPNGRAAGKWTAKGYLSST
jgi:hypothetical protein